MATLVHSVAPDSTRSKAVTSKEEFSHIDIVELDGAGSSPPTASPISNAVEKQATDPSQAKILDALATIDLNATYLISSPYGNIENQLVLDDLESPYRLFACALTALRPIREDYATGPYLESFNWSQVFTLLRELCKRTGYEWQERSFYTVIFRSTLLPGIDRDRLGLLDQKSHEEACASGGLLKYWFGSCDAELRNLATCKSSPVPMDFPTLRVPDKRVKVSGGVAKTRGREGEELGMHKLALRRGQCRYKSIDFFTYQFVVEDGAETWRLVEHSEERPRQH